MTTTIIGIDCATQDKRVGLALGRLEGVEARVERVTVGTRETSVLETVTDWIAHDAPTLIALDAPLGWPSSLGEVLPGHKAGAPIEAEAHEMSRRLTDQFVKRETGKQPLDVGADHIARTAHAALRLLQELRRRTGQAIPLAWKPPTDCCPFAIEVYPAATLLVYELVVPGRKQKDGPAARKSFLHRLKDHIGLPHDPASLEMMEKNDDALDAVVCVLAGADFLRGKATEPPDIETARKEGWIWFRKPGQ